MTKLEQTVLEIIKDEGTKEEQKSFMEDVMQHGCISGIVGELITYSQTVEFYNAHRDNINELLYEMLENTGCSIEELFGDKWDKEDPLALVSLNQNLLSWFAFEGITREIYEKEYETF